MRTIISTSHVVLAIALATRAAPIATPTASPVVVAECQNTVDASCTHAPDVFETRNILDMRPAPESSVAALDTMGADPAADEDMINSLWRRDDKLGFPGYCVIA